MTNSLQAVLERKSKEKQRNAKDKIEKTEKIEKTNPISENTPNKKSKTRAKTVLIGGHFPKEVAKQLKIIAAEEETSNQELLKEALDLLFVKKGKSRIGEII